MLGRFLTLQGAWVVAASDAFDGIKAVKERRPDVVLSEISLPNRDGFQLLRDIRALGTKDGGGVPVIAMTAFERIADRDRAMAAGFQAHLDKPFGPDSLLEVIKSVLRANYLPPLA